jgi:hypothetical protein
MPRSEVEICWQPDPSTLREQQGGCGRMAGVLGAVVILAGLG